MKSTLPLPEVNMSDNKKKSCVRRSMNKKKSTCLETIRTLILAIDIREKCKVKYQIADAIIVLFVAYMCGQNDIKQAHRFAKNNFAWFQKHLGKKFKLCCRSHFYNLIGAVEPSMMHKLFTVWLDCSKIDLRKVEGVVIAIDGKVMCGSTDESGNPIHIVSAFHCGKKIVICQMNVEEKSNEITAIPKLISRIDVKGRIVTVDAMGTQVDIAKAILDGKGDYVFIAKDNQKATRNALKKAIKMLEEEAIAKNKKLKYYTEKKTKSHGRYEQRKGYVCNDTSKLPKHILEKWPGIQGFGVITTTTREVGTLEEQVSSHYFFYSVQNMTAKQLLSVKREHWAIESNLHWTLDVIFREDYTHYSAPNVGENTNVIRHMAYSALKASTFLSGTTTDRRNDLCSLSELRSNVFEEMLG